MQHIPQLAEHGQFQGAQQGSVIYELPQGLYCMSWNEGDNVCFVVDSATPDAPEVMDSSLTTGVTESCRVAEVDDSLAPKVAELCTAVTGYSPADADDDLSAVRSRQWSLESAGSLDSFISDDGIMHREEIVE